MTATKIAYSVMECTLLCPTVIHCSFADLKGDFVRRWSLDGVSNDGEALERIGHVVQVRKVFQDESPSDALQFGESCNFA